MNHYPSYLFDPIDNLPGKTRQVCDRPGLVSQASLVSKKYDTYKQFKNSGKHTGDLLPSQSANVRLWMKVHVNIISTYAIETK